MTGTRKAEVRGPSGKEKKRAKERRGTEGGRGQRAAEETKERTAVGGSSRCRQTVEGRRKRSGGQQKDGRRERGRRAEQTKGVRAIVKYKSACSHDGGIRRKILFVVFARRVGRYGHRTTKILSQKKQDTQKKQ